MSFAATYNWALEQDISSLKTFVSDSHKLPLYTIGSGGSLTSATLMSMLHEKASFISRSLTPFEFLTLRDIPRESSVSLISAAGRNRDILASFKRAAKLEPQNLILMCAAKASPLIKLSQGFHYTSVFEFKTPTGKDGFLATNSLLAMCIFLIRAYMDVYLSPSNLPTSLDALSHPQTSELQYFKNMGKQIRNLSGKDTIVLLYDGWGKVAANDAESKLSEAGLVNVQLADYRNFAHGRHNWIAKNSRKTGVIGLITETSERIANQTFDLVPEEVPIVRFQTFHKGPVAALALLVDIIQAVRFFGELRKIDPGRPGIPPFGRKIYNLRVPPVQSCNQTELFSSENEQLVIRRKISDHLLTSRQQLIFWRDAFNIFSNSLAEASFSSVIFDYDGTLCSPNERYTGIADPIGQELVRLLSGGIIIGIATGRGKSVRKDLHRIIPKEMQSKTVVGYYNCSDIGILDDDNHPDLNVEPHKDIQAFARALKEHRVMEGPLKIDIRPNQISLEMNHFRQELIALIWNILSKTDLVGKLQILESSHSIDIIPSDVSKINLIDYIKSYFGHLVKYPNILTIGDKGKWPGNDYALLSAPYSLSVDIVSSDPYTCWNLAPPGHKGTQAMLDYLRAITVNDGLLKLIKDKILSDTI